MNITIEINLLQNIMETWTKTRPLRFRAKISHDIDI